MLLVHRSRNRLAIVASTVPPQRIYTTSSINLLNCRFMEVQRDEEIILTEGLSLDQFLTLR